MSESLDLNLLPLVRLLNHDRYELPGLYVAEPPRRTDRSRKQDRLVFYYAQSGNAPLTRAYLDSLLANQAQNYYHTHGSVTAALRSVAESLNAKLLERNLREASSGRQTVGWLAQVVLREDTLYLALSGPMEAYWITQESVEPLHNPQLAGRGLGLGRATPVWYRQMSLSANDTLLLAAKPAPTWSPVTLRGLHGQGPQSMRRRLLNRAGPELEAVLLQAWPGRGRVHLPKLQPGTFGTPVQDAPLPEPEVVLAGAAGAARALEAASASEADSDESTASPAAEVASIATQAEAPADAAVEDVSAPSPSAAEAASAETPLADPASRDVAPVNTTAQHRASAPPPSRSDYSANSSGLEAAAAGKRNLNLEPLWAVLGAMVFSVRRLGTALVTTLAWMIGGIAALFRRILPEESMLTLPPSTMAAIALIVPLVIVALSVGIYTQLGRSQQYQRLYEQAVVTADLANSQNDPLLRRAGWEKTLEMLDEAAVYAPAARSPEFDVLRVQVRSALDELDNVRRPNFQPAIAGGLPDSVSVSRMLLVDGDLYLLDGNTGNVLRAAQSANGYEIDRTFQCGPNFPGGYSVDPLIDISPAPDSEPETVVIGLDGAGRLLRCAVGEQPVMSELTLPFRPNEGDLRGFTQELGHFYVLDPASQAVWVYWNAVFDEEPQFFFGDQVPPMADVIDLAVEKFDLYLLHADGHLTLCVFSGLDVSPTRCNDPVAYIDQRSDPNGVPMYPPHPFSQILFTPPPDPSLYLLEPQNQAVYHFSLNNLIFQRQYVPETRLGGAEKPATAFWVNRLERTIYLAVGNEVFYANMP